MRGVQQNIFSEIFFEWPSAVYYTEEKPFSCEVSKEGFSIKNLISINEFKVTCVNILICKKQNVLSIKCKVKFEADFKVNSFHLIFVFFSNSLSIRKYLVRVHNYLENEY